MFRARLSRLRRGKSLRPQCMAKAASAKTLCQKPDPEPTDEAKTEAEVPTFAVTPSENKAPHPKNLSKPSNGMSVEMADDDDDKRLSDIFDVDEVAEETEEKPEKQGPIPSGPMSDKATKVATLGSSEMEVYMDWYQGEPCLALKCTAKKKRKSFEKHQILVSTSKGSITSQESDFPFSLAKTSKVFFQDQMTSMAQILKDQKVESVYGHKLSKKGDSRKLQANTQL